MSAPHVKFRPARNYVFPLMRPRLPEIYSMVVSGFGIFEGERSNATPRPDSRAYQSTPSSFFQRPWENRVSRQLFEFIATAGIPSREFPAFSQKCRDYVSWTFSPPRKIIAQRL